MNPLFLSRSSELNPNPIFEEVSDMITLLASSEILSNMNALKQLKQSMRPGVVFTVEFVANKDIPSKNSSIHLATTILFEKSHYDKFTYSTSSGIYVSSSSSSLSSSSSSLIQSQSSDDKDLNSIDELTLFNENFEIDLSRHPLVYTQEINSAETPEVELPLLPPTFDDDEVEPVEILAQNIVSYGLVKDDLKNETMNCYFNTITLFLRQTFPEGLLLPQSLKLNNIQCRILIHSQSIPMRIYQDTITAKLTASYLETCRLSEKSERNIIRDVKRAALGLKKHLLIPEAAHSLGQSLIPEEVQIEINNYFDWLDKQSYALEITLTSRKNLETTCGTTLRETAIKKKKQVEAIVLEYMSPNQLKSSPPLLMLENSKKATYEESNSEIVELTNNFSIENPAKLILDLLQDELFSFCQLCSHLGKLY